MIPQTTLHSEIRLDCAAPVIPLRPFWNATGYANADFTYTQAFGRMYDYLSSYSNHMRYMRLHNILTLHGEGDRFLLELQMDYGNRCFEHNNRQNGDDKVLCTAQDGSLHYNWELVDRVYDVIAAHGMAPIVELIYIPTAIRKSDGDFFLPRTYPLYAQVIRDFTAHCVERYGLQSVRGWYFEIWNEPDNIPLWREDATTFCALYDYMENAVHSVDDQLRVGGPATKQFDAAYILFERFLKHCAHGVNYCTGAYGTRVDFLSVHCKGGWPDSCNPSSNIMFDAMQRYLDILKKYPDYQKLAFFNDESDIVWAGCQGIREQSWLNFRNTHYAPGFVCKMVARYCTELEDAGVNLAVVDSDNAHLQWERSLFSGNRSQLTPLGAYPTLDIIKKPFFNAYVLLSRLGTQRLPAQSDDPDFGKKFGALPTRTGEVLSILVWNFEDGISDEAGSRTIRVLLENHGLQGAFHLTEYRIDAGHSNAYSVWREMGAPQSPDAAQIARLRAGADLELAAPIQERMLDGKAAAFELDLPQHAVSLLLLTPENPAAPTPASWAKAEPETGYGGNPQVFLKWEPSGEADFLCYRILRKQGDGEFQILENRLSQNTATYVDMDTAAGMRYTYRIDSLNTSMVSAEGAQVTVEL